MLATGGVGNALPIVSNIQSVRALNKSGRSAQNELCPRDVIIKRTKRKWVDEEIRKNLAAVQTPLVEAHRPSKKHGEEASRLQKNYRLAVKKSKIPKSFHTSMKSIFDFDD